LFAAERLASASVEDSSDRCHVFRLAFLNEAGLADDLSYEDREGVSAAFEQAVAALKPPRRMWYASLVVVLLLISVSLVVMYPRIERWASFDAGASPVGQALGVHLTEYGIEMARHRSASSRNKPATDSYVPPRNAAQARITAGAGEEAGAAALDMFTAHSHVVFESQPDDSKLASLSSAVLRFNGLLRDVEQPYFVDLLFDHGAGPVIVSYYIARERTARVHDSDVRLIHGQRLDTIDRSTTAVGYSGASVGAAVVNLDLLERDFVVFVAPALVESGGPRLVDDRTRDEEPPWLAPLEARAGEMLRRDAHAFVDVDADYTIALLARRSAVFYRIARKAIAGNFTISQPTRVVWSVRMETLGGLLSATDLNEWKSIEAELSSPRATKGFHAAIQRFADSVGRHELQHQFDYRSGPIVIPQRLRAKLRIPEDVSVLPPTSNAAQIISELSARLAEIAASPAQATTALTLSSNAVFNKAGWTTPHFLAMATILAALSEELGTHAEPWVAYQKGIDREVAAKMYSGITDHTGKEIAKAASSAYAKLFGNAPPDIELGPWRNNPAWSH